MDRAIHDTEWSSGWTFQQTPGMHPTIAAIGAPGTVEVNVPDFISARGVDWDSQDSTEFDDGISAKGVLLNLHQLATDGLDVPRFLQDRIEASLAPDPVAGVDADVRGIYAVMESGGTWTLIGAAESIFLW